MRQQENTCKRCELTFPLGDFYHKGNVLLHCAECRSELRASKREEIRRLLELEEQLL